MKTRKQTNGLIFTLVILVALAVIIFLVIRAAGPNRLERAIEADNVDNAEYVTGLADVESVSIELLESFPVRARAIVRGNLPDTCTEVGEYYFDDHSFNPIYVTLETRKSAIVDSGCADVLTPFAEYISLDILNFPAGTYVVEVNNASTEFTLDVDNMIGFEDDKS